MRKTEMNNQEKDIWQGFSHLVSKLVNTYGWTKLPLYDTPYKPKGEMTQEEFRKKMKQWSEQYDTSSYKGDL